MNEFPDNLWAPWRMEYIESIDKKESECFICDYCGDPQNDEANRVICRTERSMMLLNLYPYTNGHMLIAPLTHKADMDELTDDEMTDIWFLTRDAKTLLQKAYNPHGFNIGINFGRCAGAGLPGHLHVHIVPRWNGDTNFMSVLGDVRVIPQSLAEMGRRFRELADKLGLPSKRE